MNSNTTKSGPSLAAFLTRRLTWIAVAVFIINSLLVGVYYASNSRALDTEVIAHQMERLENELVGRSLPKTAQARALYREHPLSYAFALVDRSGLVIDTMNPELIPAGTTDLFADHWMTRLDHANGPLLVGGHEFYKRKDGLRAVFVMKEDPAHLLWRAYLTEFYEHVWLPIVPLLFLLIGTNVFLIRRGLEPISTAASWARKLKPGFSEPPPDICLPAEIADLIDATQRTIVRLEEALSVETRRSAEIAHALRTPVAVLIARVDALPDNEAANSLKKDIIALSRTVQQVLASARAEVLSEQDIVQLDLRIPAESVASALVPYAYEKGMELTLSLPPQPIYAMAIPEGVELALYNLVENAILHVGVGRVDILVGPGAVIRVRDQGHGLPEGINQQLFEPFWRGKEAKSSGSGLGLSIVKRLQRIQGGSVTAKNSGDGGAEFEISWPALKI